MVQVMLGWETIACPYAGCGILFALPMEVVARYRETEAQLFCPARQHSMSFKRQAQQPPREVVLLKQEIEVCRRNGINAEHRASVAERRLRAARTGHAFLEGGKWRGLCPSCFAEQPRGGKKARARRWGKMHCAKPRIPTVSTIEAGGDQ